MQVASRTYAIDFHVHTPISRCHEPESWSSEAFLDAAATAGLDALVLTDHHSADNAWELHERAADHPLEILPGMELTTRDGHLLVMFDPRRGASASEELLKAVAVPDQHRGNGSFVLGIPMLEAIEAAHGLGAFCIPAHVDRWPNGFLEKQISFRVREQIVASPLVTALEVTLPATQQQWESGKMPPFTRPLSCVRGSDSHGLKEVGRRPTWMRAESTEIASIRKALEIPGCTKLRAECAGSPA